MNFTKLKEKALASGLEAIELYQAISTSIAISTFNGEIDECNESHNNTLSIRGVYNGKITTVSLENDSDDEIDFVINTIKENACIINSDEPYFIYEGDKEYPTIKQSVTMLDSYTISDKKELCFKLEKAMKKRSDLVTTVETAYEETSKVVNIMNSNGLNLTNKTSKAIIFGSAVLTKDSEMKSAYDYVLFNDLKDIDICKLSHDIVDREATTFNASSIESNKYNVVIENKTFISLLSAFSGIFSADAILKKMSMLENKINEEVFGKNITLIDDPLNELSDYQTAFDDEGVSSKVKDVVKDGVLKTYLHNLKTAKMMDTSSTGNGFKASTTSNVSVFTSNFYLKPDTFSFDDLLQEANNGVFITSLAGLHSGINPISGDFNLQASGFEIVDGKISRPLTLIILSGNFIQMMNSVSKIGNDFTFKNRFGSASVLISNMSVSGNV